MIPRLHSSYPATHDLIPSLPLAQSRQVALTIRIDTLDALNVRLALHRAPGQRIGIYLLSVDHARAQSTLQLQCAQDELDDMMLAVMRGLPQAEFGPVRAAAAITGC